MKRSFRFKSEQLEYTLQLKRNRFPWWILLFLLPLLLLIRFEKTVFVDVSDTLSKMPVANVEVKLTYIEAFALEKGNFFTSTAVKRVEKTDANGRAVFGKLRYSVYSWIFRHGDKLFVTSLNNCFEGDTIIRKYHNVPNKSVLTSLLKPAFIAADFLVVDEDDNEPIPGAQVDIISEVGGKEFSFTSTTSSDGRVVFGNVPKCGNIKIVKGQAEGYHADSIVNKHSVELMAGSLDSLRKLLLRPIRKPVVFYIEDCKTQVGLAEADALLDFRIPGRKGSVGQVKVKTNINGVGKGIYDSAKMIAELHISGSKDYYKDGELAGWHKVKEFTDSAIYKKPQRTFCLEPEPNPLVFINIDELNKRRLPGVKNKVTITNNAGISKVKDFVSNARGEFSVTANPGDQISIHAQLPPCYEDNNYTLKNADAIQLLNGPEDMRKIPMKPITTELKFRVIDEQTGVLIPDADLSITGDGLITPVPSKSGNGEFIVKATICSRISITASKPNYGSNSQKINNKDVQLLTKSLQEQRDIPLKSDPPKPCKETQVPNQNGDGYQEIDMQSPNAKFIVEYDMDNIADRMIIYCGKGKGGSILFEIDTKNKGKSGLIDLSASGCNNSMITVEVVAATAGGSKDESRWTYKFTCLD